MQDKESFTTSISELTSQLARQTGTTTPPLPAAVPQAQQQQGETPKAEDTQPSVSADGARPQHDTGQAPEPTHPPPNGTPLTPRRMSVPSRLSAAHPSRNPLSPVLDPALGFSVARRPRLDFARACTSLHHSTLAESSPESSPLASACPIPKPPAAAAGPHDSPTASSYPAPPSSIGSASMPDYPPSSDSSSDSADDDPDGDLDLLDPPADPSSLLPHHKPRPPRPSRRRPPRPAIPGLFISPTTDRSPLLLSGPRAPLAPSALDPPHPEPLRRPVTRRGSLLPKTKNFQRIKAALIEESCPVDVEVKREAEITRQIRDDPDAPEPDPPEPDAPPAGFQMEAQKHGGFWFGDQMEGIVGAPPVFPRSADGDVIMDSPVAALRSTKRRRAQEDWVDAGGLKRRAVSPGVGGSPRLGAQSPTGAARGRGVGLMGMNDTNDGLMKMSLQ